MIEKLQKMMAKCALTLPRQSGRSASTCAAAALAAVLALPAAGGPIDWAHQRAGAVQSNGAVTVKTLSGGAYSATGNPSGAVAKTNQNAAVQPPTVIVQATASLPIRTVGETCLSSNSGSAPNQTANEGTAILADRSALLTCQGGTWGKQAAGISPVPGYGGQYILGNYCVMVNEYTGSCSCPSGYSAVESGRFSAGWYYYSYRCTKI